ncbi:MAG: BlaI/MecI/CopY family transcriptional regulator [Clostridia bacterium]|nr:BlaI/MecI/CopY family transcriptional regulator [Clostridia bacterium]
MDDKLLCESDYRFMDVIWRHEPVGSTELVNLCNAELGWKKSTTYTMLRKMCEKGFAVNNNSVITSSVEKSAVQKKESLLLINRDFGGSLPSFLVSFFGGRRISDEEADELKTLIDSHRD